MHYDLLIIGSGSGGLSAANHASKLGARVAICEKNAVGGTCVNCGCVPKKLFVYASQYGKVAEVSKNFGWNFPVHDFSWQRLVENKNRTIASLNLSYEKSLAKKGIALFKNKASFIDKQTLQVGQQCLQADKILIATGSSPFIPEPCHKSYVLTSNSILQRKQLPQSIAIIGGGYIAMEFASIFHNLGREVTVIERAPSILENLDTSLSSYLQEAMRKQGIIIHLNTEVQLIQQTSGSIQLSLSNGKKIQTQAALCATGRKPRLDELALSNAEVKVNQRGLIDVDAHYRTSTPNIYAVGDVVGKKALTPIAIREAKIATEYMLTGKTAFKKIDYETAPTAVFSSPSVASCGLTENQAKKQYRDILIYQTTFEPLKTLITQNHEDKVFMKLIVEKKSNRVLGVHTGGECAAEIIQIAHVVLMGQGTKAQFDAAIAIHPTVAEELLTLPLVN